MLEQGISAIIIVCNKKDVYLTRTLVASIRYYYPHKELFLVKDYLNGNFSTVGLERYFDVSILDLGLRKYGWTTAKMHILLSEKLAGRKFLMLDSDIVFVGRVLELLEREAEFADFVVSPELTEDYNTAWFRNNYYNFYWAKGKYPRLHYPGFTFNTGQMVITGGIIKPVDVKDFITLDNYPYWSKEADLRLPTRDQSLLNILLPVKAGEKRIRLNTVIFMYWSELSAKRLILEEVKNGTLPLVVHWMGAVRSPCLRRMTRSDILFFFQREYYKRLPFGEWRRRLFNLRENGKELYRRPARELRRAVKNYYLRLKLKRT
jgi:hypothetical protein